MATYVPPGGTLVDTDSQNEGSPLGKPFARGTPACSSWHRDVRRELSSTHAPRRWRRAGSRSTSALARFPNVVVADKRVAVGPDRSSTSPCFADSSPAARRRDSRRRSSSASATPARSAIVRRGRRDPRVRALHQRRDRRGLESRDLVEPASGEPLGTAQLAGEAEIDRAVEAARGALDGDWGKTPANERSRLLHALADAIAANRKELSELEARNVGKAISSTKAELFGAVENFRFYASAIGSIAGRSNPIGGSLLSYTLKEPVGVAGQIVPWNYPLLMTTWKLAPALAAGCAVVLKPDPQTPVTALRLAELAAEVGFPAGAINIVTGDGPTTGAYLVKHPGVDKVAFTGSTKTGGEIMRLCSEPIKRLTLELGGKSPNLVFADADLGSAIPSAVWSIYYSAGQSCEARSRVLVEQAIYDDFVNAFTEQAGPREDGRPARRRDPDGLARSRRRTRSGCTRSSRAPAARAARSCSAASPASTPSIRRPSSPGWRTRSTIAQEEVFGPVVTIIPFEDEKDAMRIANDVKYGLMASVWTGDPARGHRLASRIKAGTVGINMPYTAFPGPPVRRLQAVRLRT